MKDSIWKRRVWFPVLSSRTVYYGKVLSLDHCKAPPSLWLALLRHASDVTRNWTCADLLEIGGLCGCRRPGVRKSTAHNHACHTTEAFCRHSGKWTLVIRVLHENTNRKGRTSHLQVTTKKTIKKTEEGNPKVGEKSNENPTTNEKKDQSVESTHRTKCETSLQWLNNMIV